MSASVWTRLNEYFVRYPSMRGTGVSDETIEAAEHDLGREFSPSYREFLRRHGAAMLGAQPVLGLSPLDVLGADWWDAVRVTRHFWDDAWLGTADWYIISTDGAGNPIGVDEGGRVWISDHDGGGIERIADSFVEWLHDALDVAD